MNNSSLFVSTISAALISTCSMWAGIASAQDVLLSAPDGSISVSGELISFENGNYIIRTTLGQMVLGVDTVDCIGDACPAPAVPALLADVNFSGSDTVGGGLMPLLLAGYASVQGGAIEITNAGSAVVHTEIIADEGFGDALGSYLVNSTGSGDAFAGLLDGSTAIGMSSRRIRRDEARALAQAGAGSMVDIDQEHIIAVDSLLTIVNPNNPMNSISISDLARIYSGDVTNWAQLGGENLPIDVFTRPESSGTRGVFYGRVFGGNFDTGNAVILDSNAEMAEAILQNSNAIGFVGYAFLNGAKALNIISECGIETSPTAFGAKTEEYALQRRLYLYTREDMANETASQFIEFATSHAADGVVEKAGYISLGIELISQEIIRARIESDIETSTSVFEQGVMRELLVELFQWDRLSTTFRFASGSNNLERKSQLDLVRLVEHLRDLPAGTGVALVGFTDSDGAFAANRTLSERRADEAVDAVLAYAEGQVDHIDFTTFGFGELASAACNTSNEGKHVNRRVEVWIRGGA